MSVFGAMKSAITQTGRPLSLAVAGHRYFVVSHRTGQIAGKPPFDPQRFFARTAGSVGARMVTHASGMATSAINIEQ
jgi:hypothetical protein